MSDALDELDDSLGGSQETGGILDELGDLSLSLQSGTSEMQEASLELSAQSEDRARAQVYQARESVRQIYEKRQSQDLETELGKIDDMDQQEKLAAIQSRVAAAKIQKARRRQQQKRKESQAASKIQGLWSRKRNSTAGKPQLTVAPMEIKRLEQDTLLELRHMVRKPSSGRDARPDDETRRVLSILMSLPPFEEAFSKLPPRARVCIIDALEPRQLQPGEALLREQDDPFALDSSSQSSNEHETEEDRACLILAGSAAIFVEGPSLSKQHSKLKAGSALGRDALDSRRINQPFRNKFELETKTTSTIEVLRVAVSQLDNALHAERLRETSRLLACSTLKSSAPWCREIEHLYTLRKHLMKNVACFQGIEEEELDKVCQQAEYMRIACGESLSCAGEVCDGLRVLLKGTARISWPLPPALIGDSRHEASEVALALEATLCEDDESGEWELCLDKDACNIADVVATSDCEVLFVNRALYQRHLSPVRMEKVLQLAACALLTTTARVAQSAEEASDCASPVEVEPEEGMNDANDEVSAGAVDDSTLTTGGAYSEDPTEASAPAMPPVWLTPGAVAVVDGMLTSNEDSRLPLLRFFPQNLRRKICAHAKLWRAFRGEVIFTEGDPGDSLFVVIRGEVGLFRQPYEEEKEEHRLLEWQQQEVKVAVQRQTRQGAADRVFAKSRKSEVASQAALQLERQCKRRLTPRREEDWFDTVMKEVDGNEDSSSATDEERWEDDCLNVFATGRIKPAAEPDPAKLVIQSMALSALDVVGRRWQNLHPTRLGNLPEPGVMRYFIRSEDAEVFLVGQEIMPEENELANGADFINVDDIGIFTDRVSAGQALGMATPGLTEGGPPRLHNAVVLTATTDLLVIDSEAVDTVLAEMREGIPNGQLAAALLRYRQGSELTPQDLLILDGLIRKHQAFSSLECRARAELCCRMQYIKVPDGEVVYREGEPITHFFQILRGIACVYVRETGIPGAVDYDDAEDGSPVLVVSAGNTFGEQGLLGCEEFHPQTVRAEEDLELLCISCEDYAEISQDWWGEQSMRRKTAEVLRALEAENQARHGLPEQQRAQLDTEAVVQVLRGASLLDDNEPEACCEIVQQTALLHVPKGDFLVGFGDTAVDDESLGGKSIVSSPKTFHIVLSGCMGLYTGKQQATLLEALSSQLDGAAGLSDAASGVTSGDRRLRDESESGVYGKILHVRSALQRLQDTIGLKPLQASMADRVRLTHLQQKLADLEGSLGEAEAQDLAAVIAEGCTPISLSRSYTPTGGALTRSATATTIGFGTTDEQAKHDHVKFYSDAGASLLEDHVSTDLDTTQDWTTLLGSVQGLGIDMLDVSACDLELREGESFGGLSSKDGVPLGTVTLNLAGGERFRAHADTDLLVLSQPKYEQALKIVARRSTRARAAFLAKYFPSEATAEIIERLVPLFHEEPRSMGCVVVREGTQPASVWMIISGQCQCFAEPGSQALIDAAALGEETGDDLAASHKPDSLCRSTVIPKTDTSVTGDLSATDSADLNSSARLTQTARSGTIRGTTRGFRATTTTNVALPATAPATLKITSSGGRKGKALGILKEGQFVGLFSALYHQPEPLTIVASSAQVELLAISKNELFSRLPNKIIEALKESMRAQCDFYADRSAHVAALPGQAAERLEKVRSEVQQVHIPRMIDSPFLRRHGTPGLDMLDKVCSRYGGLVHPESEWLFATRNPCFFHSIRLANAMRPAKQWEAPAIAEDDLLGDAASRQSRFANKRFHRFYHLSQHMQESAADNEYITPNSMDRSQLSPKSVSQLNITTTAPQSMAEDMGLPTSGLGPLSSQILGNAPVPTSSEGTVPLLTPSRVQRLTSYGELAHQKKTVQKTSPRRVFISPGRVRPGADQVYYRSKAMREREKQAGFAALLKMDKSASVELPRRTRISEHSDEESPTQKSPQKRSNEFLPEINPDANEAHGNYESEDMMSPMNSPQRKSLRRSGTRTYGSLRRGPTADFMRSQVFTADETLGIGSPRTCPQEFRQPHPPDGAPVQNRPVWRRSRTSTQHDSMPPGELAL